MYVNLLIAYYSTFLSFNIKITVTSFSSTTPITRKFERGGNGKLLRKQETKGIWQGRQEEIY
jgi:hypothetical protein